MRLRRWRRVRLSQQSSRRLIRIYKTSETFEGKHNPLVTKALFDRVQAILDGRLYPRIEKHEFLFRRLIRCDLCGKALSGERQKGKVYYRCHDYGCRGVSLTEVNTEHFVATELSFLSLDEKDLQDFRDLLQEQFTLENSQSDDRRVRAQRELVLNEHRISRLTDAFLDGSIDKATYEERKASYFRA